MPWFLASLVAVHLQSATYSFSESNASVALPSDSKGFSLVLAKSKPVLTDEAEPNVAGGLGIGFDVYNPRESNPFNANGNIYNRPQREVSLHWDGREVANRVSPVEIRTAKPQDFNVRIENVTGGSTVTVRIGTALVYDHYFVPFAKPIDGTWSIVGATGLTKTSRGQVATPETAESVKVFKEEINDIKRHRFGRYVLLPRKLDKFGRIIATLKLDKTPKGIDAWDRIASLALVDDKGQRIEVLRCITPYRKAWTWSVDVTYLMPLLTGKRYFTWECETYGEGWAISFDLDYFEGSLTQRPVTVIPLWQGTYEIGVKKPLPAPMTVGIPEFKSAEVVTTVTGHGMNPNANNAAEFFPLWRKLFVNGASHQNTLWKEDNYLNPCRPQGGTWKYDRAGWAPGSVVEPWRVDVSKELKASSVFGYEIEPYVNATPVDGNPARHIIESLLVLYR